MPQLSSQSFHFPTVFLISLLCVETGDALSPRLEAAEREFARMATPLLQEFCVDCHGDHGPEAMVNLEQLTSEPDFAHNFRTWRRVTEMLEQGRMPPEDSPRPDTRQRRQLISVIQDHLQHTAEQHATDPGPVILRRLNSAEYGYSVQDLIGLDLNPANEFVSDAVGGEGFANVGAVQFMQDSTLERYLDAAKHIAGHAVIGTGPLSFYTDPGATGFELSAITRIQNIYRAHGFRTAAGEGGESFGLDRYARGFYAAWRFRFREALGQGSRTLADFAVEEGIDIRFAQYLSSLLNQRNLSFPASDIADRWQNLPPPSSPIAAEDFATDVRRQCEQIHQVMHDWQIRFGQNADAKEEAPVLAADSFDVRRSKLFEMNINWPVGTKTAHIQLNVESANRDGTPHAVVLWKAADIQFRNPDRRRKDPVPLSAVVAKPVAERLSFGRHPLGGSIEPQDFVTVGTHPSAFELPVRDGATSARLTVTAELDIQHGDDCIVRCTISQTEETDQGKQVSAVLANPEGSAFADWRSGVLEFASLLPQVSHREPAPSDRDPIPALFDNSYNNPERNFYHYRVKYFRDDEFLVENILDDATRSQLDQAWMDLLGAFEYHDTVLQFLAKKHQVDIGHISIGDVDRELVNRFPADVGSAVRELQQNYLEIQKAFRVAEPSHVDDVLQLAARAWRRPLDSDEQQRLRVYYDHLRTADSLDHRQAIRTLVTRVLTAPEFLFRAERPYVTNDLSSSERESVALSDWELASRLSFFLWSSLPDGELRQLAAAGQLSRPEQLSAQVQRMLRHPKAARLAAEFFGQWFGFYRFDGYRGVDPKRFPEFTDSLKVALHDEAVLFFAHIVQNDRPVREILFADYTFLNAELADHYEIDSRQLSTRHVLVDNARDHHRGGLLSLGAVLTATSAPQRTSPVKRGDWVLRRVLGTPVPPPPADAGSLPADDVVADGLSVLSRLEAHRSDVSCRNCHARIDPLGFALEKYDVMGRWREFYRDGQAIQVSGTLYDGSVITGIDGLREYLHEHESLFHRTLCTKLVGYALGRRESVCDVQLIQQMMNEIQHDGRFSDLVEMVVLSRQFRFRRAGREKSASERTSIE